MMMTHVPYKADADIVQAMQGGSVQVGIAPVQGAVSALTSGKLRALAVTGTRRVKALPDVASVSEVGVKGFDGLDPYTYYGVLGPAGMPDGPVTVVLRPDAVSLGGPIAATVQRVQFAGARVEITAQTESGESITLSAPARDAPAMNGRITVSIDADAVLLYPHPAD